MIVYSMIALFLGYMLVYVLFKIDGRIRKIMYRIEQIEAHVGRKPYEWLRPTGGGDDE